MLAGALEEAISGCKSRATDFSIAAIMSRGSGHPLRASAAAQTHLQELLREKAQVLKQEKRALKRIKTEAGMLRSNYEQDEIDVDNISDKEDHLHHLDPNQKSTTDNLDRPCSKSPESTSGDSGRDVILKIPPNRKSINLEMKSKGNCVDLESVECHLETKELWEKFYELGTEMIITKTGRRMFPTVRVSFSGLKSDQRYAVLMDIIPLDNKRYRYAYHKSCWLVAGKADPSPPYRLYAHPDSPFTGDQLKKQVVSFEKVKLTNNEMDKQGQIILNSMHRFQPRIHLVCLKDSSPSPSSINDLDTEDHITYIYPSTIFTAVTAYQNQLITKLKIDSNPFAKGFRDSSRLSDFERDTMESMLIDPRYIGARLPSYLELDAENNNLLEKARAQLMWDRIAALAAPVGTTVPTAATLLSPTMPHIYALNTRAASPLPLSAHMWSQWSALQNLAHSHSLGSHLVNPQTSASSVAHLVSSHLASTSSSTISTSSGGGGLGASGLGLTRPLFPTPLNLHRYSPYFLPKSSSQDVDHNI